MPPYGEVRSSDTLSRPIGDLCHPQIGKYVFLSIASMPNLDSIFSIMIYLDIQISESGQELTTLLMSSEINLELK